MQFAGALVFARQPNFFLMVSDSKLDAQRFYRRLGYQVVGELNDYLVAGRSEILMRKSLGPIRGYSPSSPISKTQRTDCLIGRRGSIRYNARAACDCSAVEAAGSLSRSLVPAGAAGFHRTTSPV